VPTIAIGDDCPAVIRTTIITASVAAAVIAGPRIIDAAAEQPG
jgi:hypothetical protein